MHCVTYNSKIAWIGYSYFFLDSDLKRMLVGKKFSADEELAVIEAYLEAKDKSYYINGIEKMYIEKWLKIVLNKYCSMLAYV